MLLLLQVNRFLRNFFATMKRKCSSTTPRAPILQILLFFVKKSSTSFEGHFIHEKSKICKIGDLGVVELDFLFVVAKKFLKNLLIWRRSSILKITYFSLKFSYFYCLIFTINWLLKRKLKKLFSSKSWVRDFPKKQPIDELICWKV